MTIGERRTGVGGELERVTQWGAGVSRELSRDITTHNLLNKGEC